MVTVTADCRRVDGRTLVECRLTNERDAAVRVRLESRLDGPTWPPREDGSPAEGWRDGAWTGRLDAGETVGLGFTSPAAPAEPPVRVETQEPESETATDGQFGPEPTAVDVTRELTDPRPPRVGVVEDERGDGDEEHDSGEPDTLPREPTHGADPTPTTADEWLDTVTERVERLEALDAARTLPEATVAVADADGLAGVRELRTSAYEDRDRLLALAGRAERLAARIEAVEVPVETLERLS